MFATVRDRFKRCLRVIVFCLMSLYQGHIIVVGSHFLRWPNQKGYRIALALRLLLEFDQSLLAIESPWLALLVVSTDATSLSSHLVLSRFVT